MVALSDCQEALVARRHMLAHLMRRKQLKQFFSMYLEYHSLPPYWVNSQMFLTPPPLTFGQSGVKMLVFAPQCALLFPGILYGSSSNFTTLSHTTPSSLAWDKLQDHCVKATHPNQSTGKQLYQG